MSEEGEILQFISSELLRGHDAGELGVDDDLLSTGLVDSLGVMRIVTFIEGHYSVVVPPEDVRIEHFLTVRQIAAYVETRRIENATDA